MKETIKVKEYVFCSK